ncbi:MAG: cadmium-translocating P-type ATPase, partial [Chloroflexia bacterium]|nr:cadmium-translocating P-type ATPase [Chloroflexia bacterium]
ALEIETTAAGTDNSLTTIVELVEQAQAEKGDRARLADRIARPLVPGVLVLAALVALIGSLLGDPELWITRALVVLVAASPCALAISVPLTVVAAIGSASRFGVIIKSGAVFERFGTIHHIAVDKTGTLTRNEPTVTAVLTADGVTEAQALHWAAALEQHSTHPLAKAFLTLDAPYAAMNVQEVAGKGLSAYIDGRFVVAGNTALLQDLGIKVSTQSEDEATVLLAVDGRHEASFILQDTIRSEAGPLIKQLRALGVKHLAMISGDSQVHAERVAAELGLDEVHAALLPHQKQERMLEIAKERENLVFVGDGMNDAPVLAASKVGISMGSKASDAAMESADVVILADDLHEVANLLQISRRTAAIVRQNIVFALLVKVLALCLGALGYASMWIA